MTTVLPSRSIASTPSRSAMTRTRPYSARFNIDDGSGPYRSRISSSTLSRSFSVRVAAIFRYHEPLVHLGNVGLVDLEVDAQIDGRADVVFDFFALQLANGLFEQLHIHLEADRIDVTALLTAQQVAGAAYLEVERRNTESAAEIAELFDRGQTLASDWRQRFLRRDQQIRTPDDPIARLARAAGRAVKGRSDLRG